MALVFDIEADNLLRQVTTMHCLVTKDTTHQMPYVWFDPVTTGVETPPGCVFGGGIADGLAKVRDHEMIVGHNIAGYDIPAVLKLTSERLDSIGTVFDTMIMSQMFMPEHFNKRHSIESWAKFLGQGDEKVQNEDWSHLTQNMLNRCVSDVLINEKVWMYLKSEYLSHVDKAGSALWLPAIQMEQHVMDIHTRQVQHGVRFDVIKGCTLLKIFDKRSDELREMVLKEALPLCKQVGSVPVNNPWKKNGDPMKAVVDYFGVTRDSRGRPMIHTLARPYEYCGVITTTVTGGVMVGAFSRFEYQTVNLDSGPQVKALLTSLGWKPTEWNIKRMDDGTWLKTSAKLTEESYASLPPGIGQYVAEYNILKHRRSFLLNKKNSAKGALAKVRDDGRIEATAITLGTPTSRYTHSGVACNIVKPNRDKKTDKLIWFPEKQKIPFGTELRSLFCVPKGHTQLGCDLSGIEARMLAHYCLPYEGGRAMADHILTGDFHQYNADTWGVDRNTAKGGLYALRDQRI